MRTVLWIVGGLLVATGIMSLLFSFGAFGAVGSDENDMARNLSTLGWDAIHHIAPTSMAPVAFGCIFLGVPILIGLNATAWKKTGGY